MTDAFTTDRSQTLISLIAATLCVGAFVALSRYWIRRLGRRPSGLAFSDWRRWFQAGLPRLRGISFALLVLGLGVAAVTAVNIWRWRHAAHRQVLFPHPGIGGREDEVRSLAWSALNGGSSLFPYPQGAFLVVLPLLWRARRSGAFPWSRGPRAARFWWTNAWVAWTFVAASSVISLSPKAQQTLSALLDGGAAPVALFLIVFLLWGYGFVLPPFFASLDENVEACLSARDTSPLRVFAWLAALQVLLTLTSTFGSLLSYVRQVLGFSFLWRVDGGISQATNTLAIILAPFLLTMTLTICASGTLRRAFDRNLQWWKTQFVALILLTLGVGLADGLVSLTLRGLFGLLPNETGVAIAYSTLLSVLGFLVSLLGFCFLLGNWREEMHATPPAA